LEEKRGGLQAKECHPNSEARGWKHHVVGVLSAGGTGGLHKIVRQENYVDILIQHIKTSVTIVMGRSGPKGRVVRVHSNYFIMNTDNNKTKYEREVMH
jgi:hypothetical protein